jgi:hypothetical protein
MYHGGIHLSPQLHQHMNQLYLTMDTNETKWCEQFVDNMQPATCICHQHLQRRHGQHWYARAECALGSLARISEATHTALISAQILLELAPELVHEVIDQSRVEVLASQVTVARGCLHLPPKKHARGRGGRTRIWYN